MSVGDTSNLISVWPPKGSKTKVLLTLYQNSFGGWSAASRPTAVERAVVVEPLRTRWDTETVQVSVLHCELFGGRRRARKGVSSLEVRRVDQQHRYNPSNT